MKFKVWDKEKKKFVELEGGYYIHSSGKLCYFGNAGMDFADQRYQAVLSTGISDKNKTELFDRDICSVEFQDGSKENLVIKWHKESAGYMFFDNANGFWRITHTPIEKIGSELENPEFPEKACQET